MVPMKCYQADQDRQTMLPGMRFESPRSESPVTVVGKRETSQQAALSVADVAPNQRMRIFEFVARQGIKGCNRDEIARALELTTQTVSPRVNELVRLGLLLETDQRRPTRSGRAAVVLIASKRGNDAAN